jgi:uncharacterized DUF497 family protein
VSQPRQLHFEWDEAKAPADVRKHGVAFLLAVTIFRDPRIVTMFDQDHSGSEERWISTGIASNGVLLVVAYRWVEVDAANVNVRIISARKATGAEQCAYQE